MRTLLVVVALIVSASLALAQTPRPATVTRVDLLVIPAAGDAATVAPVATQSTALSATSSACNLAPSTAPPPASLVNPTAPWEFADPFTAGRVCRAALPTGLPDGSYRVVAVFVADSCNPTGTQEIRPCPGPRSSVGQPPFTVASPVLAPPAPTGLRSTQ
jgi:hypothetical protein